MIKNKIRCILILAACIVSQQQAFSQQRVVPLLEAPASAQSLSMGSTTMGNTKQAYIYANPTVIFQTPSMLNADYSTAIMPTDDKTMLLHTLTAGYKNKKSAFFLGTRYFSMGSIDQFLDDQMNQDIRKNKIDFYSYAIDLGYAYQLNNSFSFYSKLGFADEKVISHIRAYHAALGSFYNGNINGSLYNVGVEISNLGTYSYKNKSKVLAPLVKIGGSIVVPTTKNQSIEIATDYGMFLPVDKYKFESHFSFGVDYSFFNRYSLRMGSHIGEKDDFFSAGLGLKYRSFDFSFASKIALHSDLNNIYMLGINYSI